MTFGDKIAKLRRENNYTQEQLADILSVSRQAVSKWESSTAYPETDKLIKISELFGCSLDYLLKDTADKTGDAAKSPLDDTAGTEQKAREEQPRGIFIPYPQSSNGKKSERTWRGLPLWHIGKNAHGVLAIGLSARGIIAVGLKAKGIISLGLLSMGVISVGFLSLGLLAFGSFALGLAAAGNLAVGIFAAGALCFGIISVGAIAVGEFSFGALAIGKYVAVGDEARAAIAIGGSRAIGSIYQKTGTLTPEEAVYVKQLIDTNVPSCFAWAKELVKHFL